MAFIDTATRSQLIELYVAYFNRAPDADGLAYWSDKVANGGWTVATVARSFMDQTEVKSTYPDYMTSSEIVDKVYTNVLNRAADADGKTYWVNQLNTGKVTKADLIQAVVNAAKSTTGTATDAATLTNKTSVGEYFAVTLGSNDKAAAASIMTGVTSDAATVTAAKASSTAANGQTFTLTTGVDTITGTTGNDTINGTGTTLTALDVINGGAGTDKLVIRDDAGVMNKAIPAGMTITNVETMEINTAGGLGLAAVTATAQVNTYTMPTITANVQQSNQYVFDVAGVAGTQGFTYNGGASSFAATTTAATNATNFAAAVNTAAGQTIAYVGAADATLDITTGSPTVTVDSTTNYKVGMSITGTGVPAGAYITAITDATTMTISANATATTTNVGNGVIGGGTAGVTVLAPTSGTATPTIAFTTKTGGNDMPDPTASLIVANVDGNQGDVVNFTYGSVSGSYTIGATREATEDAFVAAINAVAGSTVAANTSALTNAVTVTAPTAGVALPSITFSGTAGNLPSGAITIQSSTSTNVTPAPYDLSGISSLTDITITAAGASDVKVSDTANVSLTTTTGAVAITGGKAVTTSGATGAVSITGAAGITSATVTGGTGATIADNGTEADTLTTVSVSGLTGATTISSDALNTLSVANSGSGVTVTAAAATRTLDLTVNKLTGGAITDAEATTLNITSTGTASTGVSLSAAKATTVTIAGDKALTSTGETFTVATAITSTNTAGVTLGTELANTTAFTGGAGNDSIKIAATTKAISMGAGDDTVTTSVATIGAGGTVDGGDGTDTISMTSAHAITATANATAKAAFADKLSGFERLTLAATATTGEVKLNNLDNINYVNVAGVGNTVDLTLSGAATGFTLNANNGTTGDGEVIVALATDGTADVLNVGISNSTAQDLQALTANGFETIAFTSDDTATTPAGGFKHVVSALTADAVKTITVAGDAGFNLGYTGTTATLVDASGITKGAFDWTAGALAASSVVKGSATGTNTVDLSTAATASTFVTYTGGTGNDVIANTNDLNNVYVLGNGANSINNGGASGNGNNTVTGGTGVDTIKLGNGNNTINAGDGDNVIIVGTGSNTITTGSGNDSVTVGAAAGLNVINVGTGTDTVVLGGKQTASGYYTSVTGMSAGDVINLDAVAGGTTTAGALGAKITLGAESNFANYLDAATSGDGGTNAILKWFQYNGNTYLVVDDNAAATFQNGDDSVIQLVGLVDLSTATTTTGHVVTLV